MNALYHYHSAHTPSNIHNFCSCIQQLLGPRYPANASVGCNCAATLLQSLLIKNIFLNALVLRYSPKDEQFQPRGATGAMVVVVRVDVCPLSLTDEGVDITLERMKDENL